MAGSGGGGFVIGLGTLIVIGLVILGLRCWRCVRGSRSDNDLREAMLKGGA
jgi:hypothetical protein